MSAKVGILLLNLGGPEKLEDVKPFLYNLFSDPDILVGIPTPFRQILAFSIAQLKGPSSIQTYVAIGGGSPQLKWTRIQAQGLNVLLSQKGVNARTTVGMRASNPNIETGLKELREWGAEEVVLFPLFPHFSTTTTGSCFKEARRILKKWNWSPKLREIRNWPDQPGYIRLLKTTLEEKIALAKKELGPSNEPIHVMFSAHSLPMKIIERGDPYPQDVDRTIKALVAGLDLPWSVAFQSRNGKMPWLTPYTEDELERLGHAGQKRIIVVPVSFVSDHIETLWELDQLYADIAKKSGITHYYRTRSFNDDPEFLRVLEAVYAQ